MPRGQPRTGLFFIDVVRQDAQRQPRTEQFLKAVGGRIVDHGRVVTGPGPEQTAVIRQSAAFQAQEVQGDETPGIGRVLPQQGIGQGEQGGRAAAHALAAA